MIRGTQLKWKDDAVMKGNHDDKFTDGGPAQGRFGRGRSHRGPHGHGASGRAAGLGQVLDRASGRASVPAVHGGPTGAMFVRRCAPSWPNHPPTATA